MNKIIQNLKSFYKKTLNSFLKKETVLESKKKWRQLAQKNANYYVLSTFGENVTEDQFTKSGENDFENLIKSDVFIKEFEPLNNKRILEIGCGTGRVTEFMANNFAEVYGVDIADEMVEHSKKRLVGKNNVNLFVTDGLSLPFADDFFDIVFSFIVFQHMPDEETVIKNFKEIARILKKKGLAKIQVRGEVVVKGNWFYGPSFSKSQVEEILSVLPVEILRTEGEGSRYFWIWFKKL